MTIDKKGRASLIKYEKSIKKDIIKVDNMLTKLKKEIKNLENEIALKKVRQLNIEEEQKFLILYKEKITMQILAVE